MFTKLFYGRFETDLNRRIKNQSLLFILCVGLNTVSCGLATEDVDDAGQIKPIISLTGTLNNTTRSYKSKISVLIKNNENNAIEIYGGTVKVNGYTMTPPNQAILSHNKHEDYIFSGDIVLGELYTFEIILSNGQVYQAWIESPEVFATTMEVPPNLQSNKDAEISWQVTDDRYPQHVLLNYYDKDEGFTKENQVRLKIATPSDGVFRIDEKYIHLQNVFEKGPNKLRVYLQAQTDGILDSQFATGGAITCTYRIYNDTEIY